MLGPSSTQHRRSAARELMILISAPCSALMWAFCVQGWSKSPRPEGVTIAKPGHKPVFVPKLSLPAVGSPSDYGTSHSLPSYSQGAASCATGTMGLPSSFLGGSYLLPLCSACCEHEVKRRS